MPPTDAAPSDEGAPREPAPAPAAFTHEVEVSLRDLDALGHVNHAVYLSYIEVARTHYVFERRGVSRIEDLDFILGSVACTYHSPAYLHETLVIAIRPGRVGRKSWTLHYEIREKSGGRLIARAETALVQFDYRAGRSVEVPAPWREILARDGAAA